MGSNPCRGHWKQGVFWVQGEKDSSIKNYGDIPSKNYYKNLKNVVTSLRTHLNLEKLPFFILQVGSRKN